MTNKYSIRSLLIQVVMLITSIALIFSIATNLYFSITAKKQDLTHETEMIAHLLSHTVAAEIAFDDPQETIVTLQAAASNPNIDNIHVYSKPLFNDDPSFFASYKRQGISEISPDPNISQRLPEPKFTDNHLELVKEVRFDNEIVGYIYIKANLNQLTAYITKTVLIEVGAGILIVLSILFFVYKLQKTITTPIDQLINVFKKVARDRDYTQRAESFDIKEINYLSESFNTMNERTRQHIEKQQQAEQEIIALNQSLEQKVSQRTDALKEANQELLQTLEQLHQYQNQIVETEKMASLGDMVAGIAHEVNTPIGLGVTASTLMLDRMATIEDAFNGKTLKASQLGKFIEESNENLGIIYRNLNRAADLISSFKQVAVDQSSEANRVFTLQQFMHEVLLSLRPKLKKTNHEIIVNCDEDLTVESKPGPLNQIMINLIMNSVIHGFEDIEQGTITIELGVHAGNLELVYRDNGQGMPEHLKKRIFDPFVTTKRGSGGSGLGMHLVYNLVTQALGGTISVESEVEEGVTFVVNFPVKVLPSVEQAGGGSDVG